MADAPIPHRLKNPVLWLLLYGCLAAGGLYGLKHIPVEVLPQFSFPQIGVVAHAPGLTPEDLESQIARPVEAQLMTLPNVVEVRSSMGDGTMDIAVRFSLDTDVHQDYQAVRSALDQARTILPANIRLHADIMGNAINEVSDYALKLPGDVPLAKAQRLVQTAVAPAIRSISGVQRVNVFGGGHESLWIQPQLSQLQAYGVGLQDIAKAVRDQVMLGTDGYLRLGHQDVQLEARHLPVTAGALEQVMVNGRRGEVPLGKLATIVHTSEPQHNAVSLDGLPAVVMVIFKQPGASTLSVTRQLGKVLDETRDQLPAGVQWVKLYSQGHLVSLIGSDLGRNLVVGGLLAILVLFALLGRGRGAWILAISIPLSLLFGIGGLFAVGQSLNLLTLGALSIAVGLLVDDAIIVFESICYRWESGLKGWEGVRAGVGDIAGPDVSGTLTTVSVFVPLLFVGGLGGLFSVPFALAMSLALLASLLVSLTLIPLLMGVRGVPKQMAPGIGQRTIDRLQQGNRWLLQKTLDHPKKSLGLCAGLLALSLISLALVPVDFLPLPNEGVLLESFTLPPGSSLLQTRKIAGAISDRLRQNPDVAHTYVRIGSPGDTAYTEGSYAGEIEIVLKASVADHSLDAIASSLLQASQTPGVQLAMGTPTLERVGESLSGLPQPFVLRVFGPDLDRLRRLASSVTDQLKQVPLLSDVFDNDGYPITQLRLRPDLLALRQYHLSPAALQTQLSMLLGGTVLASLPYEGSQLDLFLRKRDVSDMTLSRLRELPIHGPDGWVPLDHLAHLRWVVQPNQIRHIDGARALDITAIPLGPLGSVVSEVRKALSATTLPPGYRIAFGGLLPQLEQAGVALLIAAAGAFVLMVGILVLQFDGLRIPGLLLLQLPLAVTGGAMALLVSGVGFNATGLVAFLTLIGISLNHGIVLLHRVRRNETAGLTTEDAVLEAVAVRFRPILLTTVTAVLGMLPTALGWGKGAAPEQGLAVVILGGIVWSALLSTNLLPALYLWRARRATTR